MSVLVDCPSCSRKVRVPDEVRGAPVRCPSCGGTFDAAPANGDGPPARRDAEWVPPAPAVPRLEIPPVPQLQVKVTQEENVPPEKRQSPPPPPPPRDRPAGEGLRSCPRCGEEVGRNAVRCVYCNLRLDDDNDDYRPPLVYYGEPEQRRDVEPHRGGLVLTLGILSIVAAASILTTILAFLTFLGLPLGIAAWVMGHRDLRKMRDGVMDVRGRGSTQAGWICGIIGTVLNALGVIGCGAFVAFIVYLESQTSKDGNNPGGPPAKFQQGSPLRLWEYVPRSGGTRYGVRSTQY